MWYGKSGLAQLRSEGNGCPFLDLLEVSRTATISLELEWGGYRRSGFQLEQSS